MSWDVTFPNIIQNLSIWIKVNIMPSKFVFFFLQMIASLLLAENAIAKTKELLIEADFYCPYNCGPKDERKGFAVELAEAALAGSGYSIRYEIVPWNRAVRRAQQGLSQGVFGGTGFDSESAGPPLLLKHRVPLAILQYAVFARPGVSWKYDGPHSLEGKKVGLVAGYEQVLFGHLGDFLLIKAGRNFIEFSYGDSAGRNNLLKLINKRVDLIIDDERVLRRIAKEEGISQDAFIRVAELGPKPFNFYLAMSPKYKDAEEVLKILDQRLLEMMKSGEFEKIMKRY
ncbi:substrate-binding periplasmic protein [Bdellovibrio svalbardensis]|uniref:ABC transporter substrate-binding protein n=1 Tax=Bdellovibrio svalbardensis TaxID=2972972 RepID=A0ABT6DK05_9BACT|nr:transporter substrate-binding domain-containing protein [Bdellovibrio svalbardensis]MDG0817138.1 ABC transporter substrate-binding protein [Bdellovibrio svalbardensis]